MVALFCYSALSSAIVISKAAGLLDWSWWWALVPVWAPSVAVLALFGPWRLARRARA